MAEVVSIFQNIISYFKKHKSDKAYYTLGSGRQIEVIKHPETYQIILTCSEDEYIEETFKNTNNIIAQMITDSLNDEELMNAISYILDVETTK